MREANEDVAINIKDIKRVNDAVFTA